MTKKLYIICISVAVLFVCVAGSVYVYRHSPRLRSWLRNEKNTLLHKRGGLPKGCCFDDIQPVQILAAKKNGIRPLESQKDIDGLVKRGVLEEMSDSSTVYKIDELTHSYPYLVPKAVRLLEDIGKRTQELSQSDSRIIVTSVLRTEETVERLARFNPNATKNSCHLYGTTFDITYRRFDECSFERADMNDALHKVLEEMHRQGRCYVKTEEKQNCYHVTVK